MTFTAGQKVRASELNAGLPLFARVASDVTVISTTTLVDVTGLSLPVEANAVYALEGFLAYDSGATPDIKFALNGPSGSDGRWGVYSIVQGASVSGDIEVFRLDALGDANVQGAGGSASPCHCRPLGTITTAATAGTLKFRFAQVTSTASNTTVKSESWMKLTRLN